MPRKGNNALDYDLIRRLFEDGMSRVEIARIVHCSKSSVSRVVGKQKDSSEYGGGIGTVKVLEDPNDLFTGSIFRVIDLKFSLAQKVFANGTKFQIDKNGRTATVVKNVLVTDDGTYLQLSPSGGLGKWKKLKNIAREEQK